MTHGRIGTDGLSVRQAKRTQALRSLSGEEGEAVTPTLPKTMKAAVADIIRFRSVRGVDAVWPVAVAFRSADGAILWDGNAEA